MTLETYGRGTLKGDPLLEAYHTCCESDKKGGFMAYTFPLRKVAPIGKGNKRVALTPFEFHPIYDDNEGCWKYNSLLIFF